MPADPVTDPVTGFGRGWLHAMFPLRALDAVDFAVVWLLVWTLIVWLRTTRARLALGGLGVLVGLYLVAAQIDLPLTQWILQSFGAVGVLVVVVVFQEDIRRLFEQIAALGRRKETLGAVLDGVDTLSRALIHLAGQRNGALVVIPGREPLERHIEGGIDLDARISEPLLLSLFDPNSPGHDGAVILAGDRATRFAVHLPLSVDHTQLGSRGTRHAAGLGLAERCDALCLIVSEERGTLSVAEAGQLRVLTSPREVTSVVRSFLERMAPGENGRKKRIPRMLRGWKEALLALPVAGLLWALAAPASGILEVEREVAVTLRGLPAGFELDKLEPEKVFVTVAGPRGQVYFLEDGALRVTVDAILVELGRRTFPISKANVVVPQGLEVLSLRPDSIKISVRQPSP